MAYGLALEKRRTHNAKENLIFQYLKAIAILMVIDDHMSTRIGFLSIIFPYNSFYMPMFVFISGYFYKQRTLSDTIKRKTKTLLVPYLCWALAGNLAAFFLKNRGIVDWYWEINWHHLWNLIAIIPPPMVGAMWFAIMLLWVSIGYSILRLILKQENPVVDYILLIFCTGVGILSLKLCMKGYRSSEFYLPFLRMGFYFQFFHLGVMFRRYWEQTIQRIRTLYLCGACILTNVVILCLYGDRINFYSTCWMGQFHSSYLPLITSITGTLFWYKIMQFASERLGRIRLVDFIADNTFCIMASHLFFINIPNFHVYHQILRGSSKYSDFDVGFFQTSPWMRYSQNTRLVGFFCGLIGSLALAYVIDRVKNGRRRECESKAGEI